VANWRGVRVQSITLFVFGGVAGLKGEPESAKDEFLIAAAGPLVSFGLAGAFWAATPLAPAATPPHAVLGFLAFVNALLGGFNLLPGFPLDGGRVLRAIVWAITHSLRTATQVASYVGQAMGYLLMLLGLSRLLTGATLDGLWTALIGQFLANAAGAARQSQELRDVLRGLRVADVMGRDPAVAQPAMSLHEFVFLHLLRHGHRALPVVEDDQGGDTNARAGRGGGRRVLGIVSVSDVKDVPQPEWAHTSVAEVMTRAPLKTVAPQTSLDRALRLLAEDSLNQLPVVEGGRLVGLLTRADVLRVLQLADTLHVRSFGPATAPSEVPETEAQPLEVGTPPGRAAA
jgi:CBS domain-containing protein